MKELDWKRQDYDEMDTRERMRDRKIKEHANDRKGFKSYA